jgi:hypothetical protein
MTASSNKPESSGAMTKQKEMIEMPDEKFVAYIDILGFSNIVSKKRGNKAEIIVTKFNEAIYRFWKSSIGQNDNEINGFTFSDSLTIYTNNDSIEGLKKILEFVRKMYKLSLFENEIMLRGGLAKGEFNRETLAGFENLENKKGIKGCRFVFDASIKDILYNNEIQDNSILLEDPESKIYDFVWINKNELCDNEKLKLFYELAKKNNWSEHYSRTLDLFCLIANIDKYDIIKQKILESSEVNRTI